MKRVLLSLLLLTIVSCDSDKCCDSDRPADTFVPIDIQQLIGRWEGTYALTYDTGTDSARTNEVDMWIVFTDTSFSFQGESFDVCGTWGKGSYLVKGKVLEFEDESFRPNICTWENILMGEFTYNYDSSVPDLRMTRRWGSLLWHVEITKVPEIIHH